MLCRNCGTKNVDGAKFCVSCGKSLQEQGDIFNNSPNNGTNGQLNQNYVDNRLNNNDPINQSNLNNNNMINQSSLDNLNSNNSINQNNFDNSIDSLKNDINKKNVTKDGDNKSKIIIIIVLLCLVVLIIGIGGFFIGKKVGNNACNDNCIIENNNSENNNINNDGNDDADLTPINNNIQLEVDGVTYTVPLEYRYYVDDDALRIIDKNNTWYIGFSKFLNSYANVKANLATILLEFIEIYGPSFKLTEKNINGENVIYGEVFYENQYIKMLITELNSTTSTMIGIFSYEDDSNLVDIALDIASTAEPSRVINTNNLDDFNKLMGAFSNLNE